MTVALVDVTIHSREMGEMSVVLALINVMKVKEIVTVIQTAMVTLGVVKTIVTLVLDFLKTMTVAITQLLLV